MSLGAPLRVTWGDVGLLGMVGLVWGAAYVFIREGIVLGATPLAFAATRYALSAVAFILIAIAVRLPLPSRRAVAVSATVGGLLVVGLYGGLLYWGEQFTTGGYAAVLASTIPIMTVAIGFPLLASERLGRYGLLGIGVGFVGVALLVLPGAVGSSIGTWQGPFFILVAMLSAAMGSVLLRRFGGGAQSLWQIGTQFAVAGAFLGGAAVVLSPPPAVPGNAGVWGALAFLVLLSSVVGYFGYFALHHRVGPVRANIVAYLAPLVGVAVGSGIFGEPVNLYELAGVAVVLGGVTLVLRDSIRRP